MNFQYHNNQCVNLNSINDTLFWQNNSTNNTIRVQPYMWPPIITYGERLIKSGNTSILYYQFCGPLIVLFMHFANYIKVNVQFQPMLKNFTEILGETIDIDPSEGGIHFMLYPYFPLKCGEILLKTYGVNLSRSIGTLETSAIFSTTKKCEWSLFILFNSFEVEICYLIFISILSIGLILCVRRRSISRIVEYIWDLVSVILSDIIAHRITSSFARMLFGIWLLMSIVLLSCFSGRLFDLLARNDPIDRIDSWDDLYTKPHWRQSRIIAFNYLEMEDFIENDPSDMALDFKKRTDLYDVLEVIKDHKLIDDFFKRTQDSNAVISIDNMVIHYILATIELKSISGLSEGFDYHISESGFGTKPYFIWLHPYLDKTLSVKLNYVIVRLTESGIYEYEVRKSLKPRGYGPDINVKVDVTAYEFGPLTIKQLRGAFVVLFIGNSIAFLVLLIEIFTHSYSNTIRNVIREVVENSRIISYVQRTYFNIRNNRVNPQIQ